MERKNRFFTVMEKIDAFALKKKQSDIATIKISITFAPFFEKAIL